MIVVGSAFLYLCHYHRLQIVLEIRKEGDYRISIWIIIGSTLGGLLLLALLSLALWKVNMTIHRLQFNST